MKNNTQDQVNHLQRCVVNDCMNNKKLFTLSARNILTKYVELGHIYYDTMNTSL